MAFSFLSGGELYHRTFSAQSDALKEAQTTQVMSYHEQFLWLASGKSLRSILRTESPVVRLGD